MIVVDSSLVVPALIDDGEDRCLAAEWLIRDSIHVPHLLDVEVAGVLRRLAVVQGALSAERARAALEDLASLPLVRYAHTSLLPRAWELRHTVRPYDGMYVALAETLDAVLVTGDQRLARAPGVRCVIEPVTRS